MGRTPAQVGNFEQYRKRERNSTSRTKRKENHWKVCTQ